jgi:hypothetical protein
MPLPAIPDRQPVDEQRPHTTAAAPIRELKRPVLDTSPVAEVGTGDPRISHAPIRPKVADKTPVAIAVPPAGITPAIGNRAEITQDPASE